MSVILRLSEYIQAEKISINRFETELGLSNGIIAKAIRGNKTIGSDKLERIFLKCQNLNPIWLLTGNGEMLLSGEEKAVSGLEKTKECEKCEALKEKIDFLEQLNKAKDDTIKAYQKSDCDCNSDSKRTSA